MARKQESQEIGGVVVLPEERTPLVDQLLHMVLDLQKENEKLRGEIDRLKGLPETPKRAPQPSTLNDPLQWFFGRNWRPHFIPNMSRWERRKQPRLAAWAVVSLVICLLSHAEWRRAGLLDFRSRGSSTRLALLSEHHASIQSSRGGVLGLVKNGPPFLTRVLEFRVRRMRTEDPPLFRRDLGRMGQVQ